MKKYEGSCNVKKKTLVYQCYIDENKYKLFYITK